MKIFLSAALIVACLSVNAQDCPHDLAVSPSQEQIDSGKELFLLPDSQFVIVRDNISLLKANNILAELNAVSDGGGTLTTQYKGVIEVLNCLKENEMLD